MDTRINKCIDRLESNDFSNYSGEHRWYCLKLKEDKLCKKKTVLMWVTVSVIELIFMDLIGRYYWKSLKYSLSANTEDHSRYYSIHRVLNWYIFRYFFTVGRWYICMRFQLGMKQNSMIGFWADLVNQSYIFFSPAYIYIYIHLWFSLVRWVWN
jgi:hypothetical protein